MTICSIGKGWMCSKTMGFLGRFPRLLAAASDSCHEETVTFERQVESHRKWPKNCCWIMQRLNIRSLNDIYIYMCCILYICILYITYIILYYIKLYYIICYYIKSNYIIFYYIKSNYIKLHYMLFNNTILRIIYYILNYIILNYIFFYFIILYNIKLYSFKTYYIILLF